MLPAISEQAEEEHPSQCGDDDVIAMTLYIWFPNYIVVDDALFEMNFYRHQLLSQARSFALRARGLAATSSWLATTTFFVNTWPGTAEARNFCFTMRSSSE